MAIFEHIEGLVASKWGILQSAIALIKLEARLAGLSVYPLLLNICLIFIVVTTLWLSAMLLLGCFFAATFDNYVISISLIIVLNLSLFFLLLRYLSFNLKKMSFEKTREYFGTHEEKPHEPLEKASDSPN